MRTCLLIYTVGANIEIKARHLRKSNPSLADHYITLTQVVTHKKPDLQAKTVT